MLVVSIPITVAFMCRSYVIEHDCGHHSYFRSANLNDLAGNLLGFGITIPYSMWKFVHNSHHMHVGNLDKRDFNPEVWTMTITEFQNAPTLKRVLYRFIRSRFARLIIVPSINYGLACRLIHPNFNKKAIFSVVTHNILYFFLFWLVISKIGFFTVFIIYFLPLILFFGIAAFTFYGQHQFEDTYWKPEAEWNWKNATMYGATNLQSPVWFRWLVGNVVCHTAHHIHTQVPFYRLHEAQEALNNEFQFKKISISEVWHLLELSLWDEENQKLVPIKNANK
jgi:omega-6 fatty acid desaturase (delta-12 desaturase)